MPAPRSERDPVRPARRAQRRPGRGRPPRRAPRACAAGTARARVPRAAPRRPVPRWSAPVRACRRVPPGQPRQCRGRLASRHPGLASRVVARRWRRPGHPAGPRAGPAAPQCRRRSAAPRPAPAAAAPVRASHAVRGGPWRPATIPAFLTHLVASDVARLRSYRQLCQRNPLRTRRTAYQHDLGCTGSSRPNAREFAISGIPPTARLAEPSRLLMTGGRRSGTSSAARFSVSAAPGEASEIDDLGQKCRNRCRTARPGSSR